MNIKNKISNGVNQKGIAPIAIILIIIGVLVVAGGLYYYQTQTEPDIIQPSPTPSPQPTTQDETADWKTYRNDEYGFEFKYPGEYEMDINKNTPLDDLVFDFTFIHSNGYGFQIRKTNYKNIDDWYLNWRKGFKEGPQEYESGIIINPSIDYVENMEINGLPAKKVVIKGVPYADTVIYFIKNYLYSFSYGGVAGRSRDINRKYSDIPHYWERDDYKKEIEQLRQKDLFLFNQIVSTFRFIK